MRGQLFRHYQMLSMSYFDQNGMGTLISRMLSDVGVINELLSQGIINMLSDVVILAQHRGRDAHHRRAPGPADALGAAR